MTRHTRLLDSTALGVISYISRHAAARNGLGVEIENTLFFTALRAHARHKSLGSVLSDISDAAIGYRRAKEPIRKYVRSAVR